MTPIVIMKCIKINYTASDAVRYTRITTISVIMGICLCSKSFKKFHWKSVH